MASTMRLWQCQVNILLDFGDGDDLAEFNPSSVQKVPAPSYQIEFSVHSPQDIIDNQQKEVTHVVGILGIRQEHAATLLRHFRWNKERLIEKYMDDPEAVLQAAGVSTDSTQKTRITVVPSFMCDICCNDEEGMQTLALSCKHRFCRDCYEQYITLKIKEEGESRRIQCMKEDCTVVVDEKTVSGIVSDDVNNRWDQVQPLETTSDYIDIDTFSIAPMWTTMYISDGALRQTANTS